MPARSVSLELDAAGGFELVGHGFAEKGWKNAVRLSRPQASPPHS
jgi:hypothetical protein